MDVAATVRFIEGVAPVLDDVFPAWSREHREALAMRLVLLVDEYERDAQLAQGIRSSG